MDKIAKEIYEMVKNSKCDLKIQMDGTSAAHVEMARETNGEGIIFAILTMVNVACEMSNKSFYEIMESIIVLSKYTSYVKPESREQEEVMNKIIENVFKNDNKN